MPPPRTRQPSATADIDILFYALFAAIGVGLFYGSASWLSGNLANTLTGGGNWVTTDLTQAALHPEQVWPDLPPTTLLICARILPAALTLTALATGTALWLRLQNGRRPGLAGRRELRPLLARESTAKAQSLRPSLAGRKPHDIAPYDRGILIGTLAGRTEVRASWEDVIVAVMAPRSGKTSGLAIPAILAAPGPVLLTSNKAANDAFTATFDARAEVGTVWTLDPQQIAHHPRQLWWDILADARDLAGATRLAGHFVAAAVDESAGSDFWSTAASNTLAALFLAAACHGRPVTDVLAWLASPADRTPVDLLGDVGHHAVAAQLQGTVSGAVETRDGIYETARQYAACLLDPAIAAWVTPDATLPQFRPAAFASSRDTLYPLSKDGGGSALGDHRRCRRSGGPAAVALTRAAGPGSRPDRCPHPPRHPYLRAPGHPILADLACQGGGPWLTTGIKRRPLRELTPTEKTVNRALAAARAPVERGVAGLKSWRIFRRARYSPNRMTSIAKAVLTLERHG